jgi:cadmium resistance protein CadD (predicted permease)
MILAILRWGIAAFMIFVGIGYVRHALRSQIRFQSTARILWGQFCAGVLFILGALFAVVISRWWPLGLAFVLGLLSMRIGFQSALRSMGSNKDDDNATPA